MKVKEKHLNKIIGLKYNGQFVTVNTSNYLTQKEMEFYKLIGFDIFEEDESDIIEMLEESTPIEEEILPVELPIIKYKGVKNATKNRKNNTED